MYTLERLKKMTTVWRIAAALFFGVSISNYNSGGYDLFDGYMNHMSLVLPSVVMVVSFFAGVISVFLCLTFRAIQKDMADELRCLKNKK